MFKSIMEHREVLVDTTCKTCVDVYGTHVNFHFKIIFIYFIVDSRIFNKNKNIVFQSSKDALADAKYNIIDERGYWFFFLFLLLIK